MELISDPNESIVETKTVNRSEFDDRLLDLKPLEFELKVREINTTPLIVNTPSLVKTPTPNQRTARTTLKESAVKDTITERSPRKETEPKQLKRDQQRQLFAGMKIKVQSLTNRVTELESERDSLKRDYEAQIQSLQELIASKDHRLAAQATLSPQRDSSFLKTIEVLSAHVQHQKEQIELLSQQNNVKPKEDNVKKVTLASQSREKLQFILDTLDKLATDLITEMESVDPNLPLKQESQMDRISSIVSIFKHASKLSQKLMGDTTILSTQIRSLKKDFETLVIAEEEIQSRIQVHRGVISQQLDRISSLKSEQSRLKFVDQSLQSPLNNVDYSSPHSHSKDTNSRLQSHPHRKDANSSLDHDEQGGEGPSDVLSTRLALLMAKLNDSSASRESTRLLLEEQLEASRELANKLD